MIIIFCFVFYGMSHANETDVLRVRGVSREHFYVCVAVVNAVVTNGVGDRKGSRRKATRLTNIIPVPTDGVSSVIWQKKKKKNHTLLLYIVCLKFYQVPIGNKHNETEL